MAGSTKSAKNLAKTNRDAQAEQQLLSEAMPVHLSRAYSLWLPEEPAVSPAKKKPQTVKSKAVKPKAAKPQTAKPKAAKPKTVNTKATKPKVAKPKAAKRKAAS